MTSGPSDGLLLNYSIGTLTEEETAVAPAASRIPLAAKLFLLTCHDVSGRPRISPARLELGLGGALLLDLVQSARVDLVDEHVVVGRPHASRRPAAGPAPSVDLSAETRPRDPDHWVRHLARGSRTAVERSSRHVRAAPRSTTTACSGCSPSTTRTSTDSTLEHELVERMKEAVVLGRPADRETAALVSLALAVGLERCLFPRSDLRAVRQRMEEIAGEDGSVRARPARDRGTGRGARHRSGAGGAAP